MSAEGTNRNPGDLGETPGKLALSQQVILYLFKTENEQAIESQIQSLTWSELSKEYDEADLSKHKARET